MTLFCLQRSLRSSTLLDLETTPQRRELLGDWMQWFSPGLDAVVFLRIVVFRGACSLDLENY
ncbi:hypothetical protein CsSME_00012065 [Camellia sinensis var. sinensis]